LRRVNKQQGKSRSTRHLSSVVPEAPDAEKCHSEMVEGSGQKHSQEAANLLKRYAPVLTKTKTLEAPTGETYSMDPRLESKAQEARQEDTEPQATNEAIRGSPDLSFQLGG
jgi:hypothetical protein